MSLDITENIDKLDGITKEEFQENYMLPQKPVIIKNFYGKDAPLYSKWTFGYFRTELGHLEVGVYDSEDEQRKDDRSYKEAPAKMLFKEYIDLVQSQPTSRRLFLFNVFKHKKDLLDDFAFPEIASRVLKFLPFAFFGGEGAVTRIHRDMDNSNVFLTELAGEKRVVLFDPKYSELLYQFPFGTHSSVDINHPDYKKYPGLDQVRGIECVIGPRDTLFMPSGWWHHIEYKSPGIGFSMRSMSPYVKDRLLGMYQVGVLTHVDELLRRIVGDEKWFSYKTTVTQKRANRLLKSI